MAAHGKLKIQFTVELFVLFTGDDYKVKQRREEKTL